LFQTINTVETGSQPYFIVIRVTHFYKEFVTKVVWVHF
jgi:hypothetical protein